MSFQFEDPGVPLRIENNWEVGQLYFVILALFPCQCWVLGGGSYFDGLQNHRTDLKGMGTLYWKIKITCVGATLGIPTDCTLWWGG